MTRMSASNSDGFTLLEIMVSLSIIAIVLTALFRLHLQTIAMGLDADFYSTAPLLAQKVIAEKEIEGQAEPGTDSGDFGDKFPGYRWEAMVNEVASETLGEAARNLRKIDIQITRNEDYAYHLRTYRLLSE